jgi:type III restriction enzyme
VPGVNNLGTYGRWAFAEFTDIYQMQADFEAKVEVAFTRMITERATSRVDRTGKRHPLAC